MGVAQNTPNTPNVPPIFLVMCDLVPSQVGQPYPPPHPAPLVSCSGMVDEGEGEKQCHCNRFKVPCFYPASKRNFFKCCSVQQHTMIAMMVRRKELKSNRRGGISSSGTTNLQDISPNVMLRIFSYLPIFTEVSSLENDCFWLRFSPMKF